MGGYGYILTYLWVTLVAGEGGRNGKKWKALGFICKVTLTGFADVLDIGKKVEGGAKSKCQMSE